jgi:rod shape-determining protein MreC
MKYVPNDDTVSNGEHVVTSGMDRIFPRDLPVGTIVDIKPGNPFKQIRVRPAANLERLEEVIVLLTLHPLELRTESESAASQQAPAAKPAAQAPTARP